MATFFSPIFNIFLSRDQKEKDLVQFIKLLTGKEPKNLSVYFLALKHSSLSKQKNDSIIHSNERLEFLGDAVLGTIIAEYLFKKYPYKDEGFLTEIRSRIVNGESLGKLAKKIGLNKLIDYDKKSRASFGQSSMSGDAMEAFIGAVYLDRGFKFCRSFVLERLIEPHFDIESVVNTDINYKSQFIMWAQSKAKKATFVIVEESEEKNRREFTANALIDSEIISTGRGNSKKRAEQDAARRGLEILEIKE